MTGERRTATGAMAEPIGTTPQPRPRMDWSTRSRTTVSEAKRYTRFVTIMKRALLLAAVALVGAVIAYSLQPRQQQKIAMTFEKMGMVSGDLAMIKPKLTGIDSEGNPFVVTADTAVQDPKNMRRASLKNVDADVTLKDGQWMSITAPHGFLDADAKKMKLDGAIAVFTDQGSEMHTDLAYIDLDKGIVVGPHYMHGQNPSGTYLADHFRIERLSNACDKLAKKKGGAPHVVKASRPGKTARPAPVCPARPANAVVERAKPLIYLMGNVHMVLYPQKGAKQDKKHDKGQSKKK